MLRHLFAYLRQPMDFVTSLLTDAASPSQMALGFSLGMLVGLVPKGNLTAGLLAVVVLAVRANLATAGLATLLFSWLGVLADPLTHRLGLALLSNDGARPFWDWLYRLPLVPWLQVHNTVVLGNLLCGLALFLPVYALGRPAAERFMPWAVDRWQRWRLKWAVPAARWLARWSVR